VLGLAFVAAVKSAASGEPGDGAFDGPAMASQPLGGFDAPSGEAWGDMAGVEPSSQVVVVVALVGMELGGDAVCAVPVGSESAESRALAAPAPGCRGCWPRRCRSRWADRCAR